MQRNIHAQLLQWKQSSNRKPLILRGARQIGKTWSIKHFGEQEYKTLISVDFERNPEYQQVFEGDLNPQKVILSLELMLNQKIDSEQTLLFFDEIQACPRAITALRYFYEEYPALHVVAAGSFLEFALSEISFPVGRVQSLNMYPMTFLEFLRAKDMNLLADELEKAPQDFPQNIHEKLLWELKQYFFVGGLPECVKRYVQENSMLSAFEVQGEIVHTYRQDFSKYGSRVDRTCLQEVWTQGAFQVGEQIQYTKLDADHSGPTNKKAFESLCLARLLSKIQVCHQGQIPLGAGVSSKKFKSMVVDIGLMQHLNGLPVKVEMKHEDLLDIYRGKCAEQFVGQQWQEKLDDRIFYWARDQRGASAEIDFLFENDGRVIPIEVKSGHSGSLKSLHMFLKAFPSVEQGYVYSSGPYRVLSEQKITFLPLYYAGNLKALV